MTIIIMCPVKYFLYLIVILQRVKAARILIVFPMPSISHQIVFRPLMQELAKRGHEVVVITTDPAFLKGQSPKNLREIDVHDISYKKWKHFVDAADENEDSLKKQVEIFITMILSIFIEQYKSIEVQNLIKDKSQKFDLLFIEHFVRPAYSFSYLYKVPIISFNSFTGMYGTFEAVGAAVHPIIYPIAVTTKFYNISNLEILYQLYAHYTSERGYESREEEENNRLRMIIDFEMPNLSELKKNIHMTFLNTHPIWDTNRPVPPNLIYLQGIHKNPISELPKDLKTYLDGSINGVIYMSLGTNTNTSLLPLDKVKIFTDVFSELPYNVLIKWGKTLPGCPNNVRIGNWFPQSDLLRHKNIKVFITQGGHQSTSEAIDAGVPLIGIPISGDQWYNTELYLKHGIGVKLDFKSLTKKELENSIETVIGDKSYRQNVIKIRNIILDQPQSPLERAVWWTEHVLRHGGANLLRAEAAGLCWTEYYEVKLLGCVFSIFTICSLLLGYIIKLLLRKLTSKKVKLN